MKGIILALALCAACAPGSRPDPGGENKPPLRVEPPDAMLYVRDGIAEYQSYKVIAHDQDGDHDVTGEAALVLGNPAIGTLEGADFTSSTTNGGRTIVTATWGTELATSDLAVLIVTTVIEPGAPADAVDQFETATPGGAPPTIAYPATNVILPPNMNKFEFDFVPGPGQTLFELEFINYGTVLEVYTTCTPLGAGCAWTPSLATWKLLADDGRGAPPLDWKVKGLDASKIVGESMSQTLQFTGDDLIGGLYYWAAQQGTIMRYDFGHPEIAAERFLMVAQTTGTQCIGCHALSRDGKLLAVGLDIPGPATLEMYDVKTKGRMWTTSSGGPIPFPNANGANFFTISPDNMRIASSGGVDVAVRSAVDGTGMTMMVPNATMPDWSFDGQRLVFAQPGAASPGGNPGVQAGSIVTVDTATFMTRTMLVPSMGENNYYPAFSPDGSLVAFNRSNGTSFDAPDARLYIVNANGGSPAVLQANASPIGGDSWPKWSTEPHMYASGQLMWLTFSSRRQYGLHPGNNSQIWMVGIDPAKALAGQDASFAAFWLPFQDNASGNHIAQWVEEVVRPSCESGPCPEGEFCDNGECFPNPQ